MEPPIDPVALEHRLTDIEGSLDALTETAGTRYEALLTAAHEVRDELKTQNGRIDALEDEELSAKARREMRARDLVALGITASIIPGVLAGVAVFT